MENLLGRPIWVVNYKKLERIEETDLLFLYAQVHPASCIYLSLSTYSKHSSYNSKLLNKDLHIPPKFLTFGK